jgi:hypothetical protein
MAVVVFPTPPFWLAIQTVFPLIIDPNFLLCFSFFYALKNPFKKQKRDQEVS